MRNVYRKLGESWLKKLARWTIAVLLCLIIGMFIDWLLLNFYLGCCEGGVCWPDIYPQCRNAHYKDFYGDGHDQAR